METGQLFWEAAGRSVEDGEVWCRFQQDDQGGGGGSDDGGGGGTDMGFYWCNMHWGPLL